MKKFFQILCIMVMFTTTFCVPEIAKGKTLGQWKEELKAKQKELEENKIKRAETEQEIKETEAEIARIEKLIDQIYVDMANLQTEIDLLNEDIAKKDQEMKDIINFVQVSNGESAYLEYAFGAKDFTDFIYRMAVSEQLTSYNDRLIAQYNEMIRQNQQKQQELTQKQSEMAEQGQKLQEKKKLLDQEIVNTDAVAVDIEDLIDYQKEVIAMYEAKGCQNHEDVETCGRKLIPPGTAFYRPTQAGHITSEWGPRDLLGRNWHEGIDVGVGVGTPVYSIGNGIVAAVVRYDCGGNMVIIWHNINGQYYTSVYAHLSSVNVQSQQNVDRNTIVGYSGGTAGGYDQCTTGPHLHVTVATGRFLKDYSNWTYELNQKYSINPRSVINFPSGLYNRWTDRLTAY